MSGSLEGKVALVTGGSRGIGRGIALALARDGAEIIVTARTTDAAEATAEAIRESGGRARSVALDIAEAESVGATAGSLLDHYGKIPILVNNAGITADNLLLRMKPEDWDRVIQTNLSGVYRLCRALVPSMVRARYGRIVNISSVVGSIGNAGQANYAAAKAGIEAFGRSLARELASRNVTVNSVAPGFIDTDMTRGLDDKTRKALLEQVPLGRLGTVEDVAAAVRFLVGDGGDYVTGTTIHVNGGMYM
jgi:3-oxoacyl-[acyl-carrier protein] reductase